MHLIGATVSDSIWVQESVFSMSSSEDLLASCFEIWRCALCNKTKHFHATQPGTSSAVFLTCPFLFHLSCRSIGQSTYLNQSTRSWRNALKECSLNTFRWLVFSILNTSW